MAMSRFFGGSYVTSRPPMSTPPSSTSSSPASMRSAVVFPEPDGPTRTTNSPSAMWRSSASTAGSSEPGYTRVAWTKRTSDIGAHRPGRRPLHCVCQLLPGAALRVRARAEVVEAEQGGADDRRSRRRVHADVRADVGEAPPDRVEQAAVRRAEETAADDDLGRLARQVEPGEGRAGEGDDLLGEAVDDARGDGVALRLP